MPFHHSSIRSAAWLCAFCLASFVRGADTKAHDPDLPQPFDPDVARHLLEAPPFTRALNLSDSLMLTGVAYVEGRPVATIKDKATNKSTVVTEEPNAQGWRLAEVTPSSQLKRAVVKILVGSEVVSIHYNETEMTPKKSSGGKGGYMPSRIPTEQEFTGKDEKGAYIRGMPYLTDEDRSKFNNVPREVREKFLNVVHDHRDMLFKASHEDRAAFVKKVYDSVMPR